MGTYHDGDAGPTSYPGYGAVHTVEERPMSLPIAPLETPRPRIDSSFVRYLEWYKDAILYAAPGTQSSKRISPIFSTSHQSPRHPSSFEDNRYTAEHSDTQGLPNAQNSKPISSNNVSTSRRNSDCLHPRVHSQIGDVTTPHDSHLEEAEDCYSERSWTSEESVIDHIHQTPATEVPSMSTGLPVGGAHKLPNLRRKLLSPFRPTFPDRISKPRKERLNAPTPQQQAWLDHQVNIQLAKASRHIPTWPWGNYPNSKVPQPTEASRHIPAWACGSCPSSKVPQITEASRHIPAWACDNNPKGKPSQPTEANEHIPPWASINNQKGELVQDGPRSCGEGKLYWR